MRKQKWVQRIYRLRNTGTKSFINVRVQLLPACFLSAPRLAGVAWGSGAFSAAALIPGPALWSCPTACAGNTTNPKPRRRVSWGAAQRMRGWNGSWRRGERYRDTMAFGPRKIQRWIIWEKKNRSPIFYWRARSSPDSPLKNIFSYSLITKSRHQVIAVVGPFNSSKSKGSHLSKEFNSRSGRNLSWNREKETFHSQQPLQTREQRN